MSHAWPGQDGSTQPPSDPQPSSPSGGEHRYPNPAGSPYEPEAPGGSPLPVPQQATGPGGAEPTYATGAVPAAQYPPAGHPTDAASTLTMPAVQDSAGYPGASGYDPSTYPSADAYHPPATQAGYPAVTQAGYPAVTGPASAPPSGAPVSGMPLAGQSYPGAQMSAPPIGTPMSGLPYGVPAPPAAAPGKGRMVLVLAIVAALLFAAGGVMSGLFVAKSSELTRAERDLRVRDAKLDASTKEIDRLKRELEVANDKIDSVQQDLTGTKNDRDEIARQKQVISKCFDLLGKAARATTRSAYETAIKEANKVCDEAEGYL